jgi:sec-independent protein translocase protein TatC
MTKLMVGIVGGFLLSLPLTFYQLWLFIAPGLHDHERRFVLPFVALSTLCFLAGAAFCYEFVLPVAFTFFSGEFQSLNVAPQIRMEEYLSFTIKFLLVFGAIFELPILSYFLARGGLLTHRWLLEKIRYSVVVIFIVAAILTPPDVVSQLLMAGPLLVLYALCIGVAYLAAPPALDEVEGSQLESSPPL